MELVIFDLDGTLIDSKLDLANAVNAARGHLGLGPLDLAQISMYVGDGAPVLMRRALGPDATEADIQEGLEFFLEHYREHKLDHTGLYPGVKKSLDRLRDAGLRMAVLTNKPVMPSLGILEGLGVRDYFFQVYGGNSLDFKKPHPIGVNTLRAEAGVAAEATCMVGDSAVDIRTARNAGVLACGVSYGFAPQTLGEPVPDVLVGRIEEVADWVLGR